MTSATADKTNFSAGFKTCLSHNRLGDLLVGSGHITSAQLNDALNLQKQTGFALGAILKEQGLVSSGTLRFILTQQIAWRSMAACLAFLIGFSALGIQSARATSATVQESGSISKPEGGTLQEVSINRNAIPSPKTAYQSLFGTDEVRSADISPFTKWTGIMRRLNTKTAPLPEVLSSIGSSSMVKKVEAVNTYYNKVRYIEDKNNWGASDYWATPVEFTSKGGDCEDYVIAKYSALKALGVAENKMRMVVLQDTWKGIPHAILVVYTDEGAKFLDNQFKEVKNVEGFTRYQPVYSINRNGWWRHTS